MTSLILLGLLVLMIIVGIIAVTFEGYSYEASIKYREGKRKAKAKARKIANAQGRMVL